MARRHREAAPSSQGRFVSAFMALVPAGVMLALIFSGATYDVTSGSGIGMIATMVMVFVSLCLGLFGVALLVTAIRRRHQQALAYEARRLESKRSRKRKSRAA